MEAKYDPERGEYGDVGEVAFVKALQSRSIQYTIHKELTTWSPYNDLLYGDVFTKNHKYDVKRHSVTITSIKKYKGDRFVITNDFSNDPDSIKNWIIIPANVLKKYVETCEKNHIIFDTNWSNTPCLKWKTLSKIRAKKRLDEVNEI